MKVILIRAVDSDIGHDGAEFNSVCFKYSQSLEFSFLSNMDNGITKNIGIYAMIHTAFFIFLFFNLPHYVSSYMHHTGKKES